MNKAEKIDQLTPYQLEFPKEALPEIFVKDALTSDERMWVPQSENVWFRPLCLNRSQGYWVTLLKVKKAGVLSRHRHPQGVHGFVIKGRWEYLEHDWVAKEGSYLFEPPGEIHTLVVDEDCEEMITLFHNSGALIYCDEDGNTIGTTDVFDRIEAAKKHFIKVGLGEEYVNQFIR